MLATTTGGVYDPQADAVVQEEGVGATWSEHSMAGHPYEDLLADGRVIAWTEPPFGETL
jgi:hypothetical protein